jgi:hypothetical protein
MILPPVQRLLERACFTFMKARLPDVLKNKGCTYPEQLELNIASEELGEAFSRNSALFHRGFDAKSILRDLEEIRHTAVHRESLWVEELLELLSQAGLALIMLEEPGKSDDFVKKIKEAVEDSAKKEIKRRTLNELVTRISSLCFDYKDILRVARPNSILATWFRNEIPYEIQHMILLPVQSLLERDCFDFMMARRPGVLTNKGYTCPEQLELHHASEELKPYYDFSTTTRILQSLTNIRNATVHRNRLRVEPLLKLLCDAILALEILRAPQRHSRLVKGIEHAVRDSMKRSALDELGDRISRLFFDYKDILAVHFRSAGSF